MNHLDLMSGIGGFAIAARWHGMTTVGFCEIDPFCQRVLAKNFPGVPIHDDITTLDAGTVRGWIGAHQGRPVLNANGARQGCDEADQVQAGRAVDHDATLGILTGGYPCQPFSLAGKRMGEEDDRHLWPYIAALVADLRPTWCLFENVSGHISLGLDGVLSDLEEIGYACWPVVVPACALNAPHRRDRVWIMAHAESAGRQQVAGSVRGDVEGSAIAAQRNLFPVSFGPTLADTADGGVRRGGAPRKPGLVALGGEDVADATCQLPHGPGGARDGRTELADSGGREIIAGLGFETDGLPGRLDGRLARPWDGDWEADVPRVTDGCPDRANKLRALGNAIVPAVAYVLMGAMLEAA